MCAPHFGFDIETIIGLMENNSDNTGSDGKGRGPYTSSSSPK
jgi:hypothetical protein